MNLFKVSSLLFVAVFLCVSNSTEAYSTSLYKSHCSLECDTWGAVVSTNEIFIPNINIKTKGFEDECYTLDVTWSNTTYSDKKKKERGYKTAGSWFVKEMKKNGIKVASPAEYKTLTQEIFKDLTGIDNSDSRVKVNTLGAHETFDSSTERYNHYDGLGDIVSYKDITKSIMVYPIYSRLNNIIIADESIYYGNDYYPLLNQSLNNSKFFVNTYKYAKNSAGIWKRCQKFGSYWGNNWSDVPENMTYKLDNIKSALGI